MSKEAKREVLVTEDDIRKGVRNSPSSCPIALAMRRAFPEFNVAVSRGSILLESRSVALYFEATTTLDQWRFVRKFDKGKPVEPFTFKFHEPSLETAKAATDFIKDLNKAREKVLDR